MALGQPVGTIAAVHQKDLSGRMLALGFLAQNLAIGLTFGMYGAFVKPFAESFEVTRAVASSGLAIITLVFGLTSPLVGGLVSRHPIRNVMTAGAAFMAAGFALLVIAPSAWTVLCLCAVLGLGASLLGPLPSMALATNWFESGRGRAIGIVMIPLGVMVMPVVTTVMIEAIGWRATFGGFGILILVLLPLFRLVRNGPADHHSAADRPAAHGDTTSSAGVNRLLLRSIDFWIIAVTSALLFGAGTAIVTHLLPYATDLGFDPQRASLLLAVSGGMGMVGSLLFGWLSDRFGGASALMSNAFAQLLFWLLLWYGGTFWFLLIVSALVGMCGGGVVAPLSTLLSVRFGSKLFGQAFGLSALMQLPFTFGAPLLMGYLFDRTGNYGTAFLVHIALFAVAGIVFADFSRRRSSARAT